MRQELNWHNRSKIKKSRLWKHRDIVIEILSHPITLDPRVVIGNPVIYFMDKNYEKIGFCAVRKGINSNELKSLFIYPKYRKEGYASSLIRHVLKKHTNVYLVCRRGLVSFYSKFGLVESGRIFLFWRKMVPHG